MEPRIHYAKTADGVSIAYTVTGSGPTVIDMPSQPLSHQLLQREAHASRLNAMFVGKRVVAGCSFPSDGSRE